MRPARPGMVAPTRPPIVADPVEIEGGIVVAFLNLDRSPIGTLVEAKLRSKKIVNWWRGSATAKLLDDLELSTAIDIPPALDGRPPPKLPDALILCRTRIQDKDRVCEIVVVEPGLGLRLGTVRLQLTKEVGADVGKLADGTVKSLAKFGEEMTELWGVPPLRSKDLGSKYDSLRTELAGVVEEELLRRKGALLVELEHAYAIALARKHAGVAEPMRRTTPIYLTGQFRNAGDGDKRMLAVSLQIVGSEEAKTDTLPTTGVAQAEAEKALRERVKAIAKNVGGSQDIKSQETSEEIGMLAGLAQDFQKAGDPSAQLVILETKLLLQPDDFQAAQASLKLLSAQMEVHYEQARDIAVWVHVTETLPNGVLNTKTVPNEKMEYQLQQALLAMNLYRRGLFRIRDSLKISSGELSQNVEFTPGQFIQSFQGSVYRPETPRGFVAVSQRLIAEQREVALLQVRREAKEGRAGALYGWNWINTEEMMQVVLRLVTELQDEPQAEARTFGYVLNGVHIHNLKTPQGELFLQQLAEIPNPAVQAAVVKLKEQVAKYNISATPPTPPMVEVEEKDADVRFVPLNLAWKDIPKEQPELKAFCELVVPAGKDTDLFCGDGQVLLMKKKGEMKLIFDNKGQGYMFKQFGSYGMSPAAACYDGKYAWLPMMGGYGKPSRLLVVDVEKETVTEVKADSGLPSEIPPRNVFSILAASPLGPGKAFLVGSFGKTWLGTATFDGEKGTVKIIHEAHEIPVRNVRDQWRSTTLAFNPAYLFALTDPAADKEKLSRRMIIGRACADYEAFSHPLLVDPDSGKVTVVETRLNPGTATVMSQHEGTLYWVQTSNSNQKFGAEFMRLGFPDFEPTSLGKHPLPGKGHQFAFGIEDKKLHLFHDQWLTTETPDQPLQVLKGNLPTDQRTSPRHLMRSNHYGWIVIVSNFNRGYAVEFKK